MNKKTKTDSAKVSGARDCEAGKKGRRRLEQLFVGAIEESDLASHLEGCDYCRERVEAFRSLKDYIRKTWRAAAED